MSTDIEEDSPLLVCYKQEETSFSSIFVDTLEEKNKEEETAQMLPSDSPPTSIGSSYGTLQGEDNQELDAGGKNNIRRIFRQRVIKYCTYKTVLLILIIGVLVGQAFLNWTFLGLSLTKDTSYLLLAVNSTYILPLQGNKDGITFTFTNKDDVPNYDITFTVLSGEDNNDATKTFDMEYHKCLTSISKYNGEENCFLVRYWPPYVFPIPSGNIHCSSDEVHVVWKWFPLKTRKTKHEMLNYECPSDLSSYPICTDDISSIMAHRPVGEGDHIVVIRLCAQFNNKLEDKNSVQFTANFIETYYEVPGTDIKYTMGRNDDKMNVRIPLTGNEQQIAIQTESHDTVIPTEIKFNHIGYEIDTAVTCVNALVPIIMITVLVIVCCYAAHPLNCKVCNNRKHAT